MLRTRIYKKIERFKELAVANGYAVDLLSGNMEILKEYNSFIQENDEETLSGLITIFEASNINEWNIDEDYYLSNLLETFSSFEDLGNRMYYVKLLNQLAIYNINQQRYNIAINYILNYLETAVTMNLYRECIHMRKTLVVTLMLMTSLSILISVSSPSSTIVPFNHCVNG